MWAKFVDAIYLICQQSVSLTDLEKADKLLVFCQDLDSLFESQECTTNLHPHCCLKECIQDFRLQYALWVYALECCNGHLRQYPSNNRSIESQFIIHFQKVQQLCNWTPQALAELISSQYGKVSIKPKDACLIPPYCQIALWYEQRMIHLAILEDETMPRIISRTNCLCHTAQRWRQR